ncbi:MAG: aldo/keto reductase [Deltaproteobacteria bacterium]|jgi:voltage-dependent potassium channel beta subunit|nr:aldo/keto reductase [Deltaproteobacteria bacterium]
MKYRKVGNSGLKVSCLSLGGWTTFGDIVKDESLVGDIVKAAYDNGINFFDMADAYAKGESERMMGRALKRFPRHKLVLSSKLFRPMSEDVNDQGLSRKHIMESIDKSLSRIGTDYLDIFFCHRHDPETGMEETMRAMDDLIHAGKILYWGTSEWPLEKIEEAINLAEKYNLYKPLVEQSQYSLLYRERVEKEVLPNLSRYGMGLVVFSPLASGLLTGKYDEGIPEKSRIERLGFVRETWYREDHIARVRQLKTVSEELSIHRNKLAIAWILHHGDISSVITGATHRAQLESNLKAIDLSLPSNVIIKIDRIFSSG